MVYGLKINTVGTVLLSNHCLAYSDDLLVAMFQLHVLFHQKIDHGRFALW